MTVNARTRFLRPAILLGAALLLLGGQAAHAAPSRGPLSAQASPPLSGDWFNFDHQTRDVTRLTISATALGPRVHTYGACHPTDCDWGVAALSVSGTQASAVYHFSFAQVAEYLYVSGPFLRVVTHTHYTDHSGRQDYTASGTFYGSGITNWTNVNGAATNLTRLTFQATASGTGLLTAYGACHPTDCSWGTQASIPSIPAVPMYFSYNQGFAQKEVVLTGNGAQLQAQTFVRFTDGSGRPNYSVIEQFRYAG